MIPSLNIEKLRHDAIQKQKKEKLDKENAKKLQQKQYDYQNYLNLSHIKKSSSFKMIKDEYYDLDKLDKEFEDFLEYSQLYKFTGSTIVTFLGTIQLKGKQLEDMIEWFF